MKDIGKRLEHVQKINDKFDLLSQWETGFLESISNQFNRRGTLSPNQCKVLARMEQTCSAEALETRKTWEDAYGPEKHEIATICAKYYKSAGYFTSLAWKVLEDPQYKLTARTSTRCAKTNSPKRS